MNFVFAFFLRLFICFVAAKMVLLVVDLNSRAYLLSLTIILLVNVYLLDYLVFRDRRSGLESSQEAAPAQDAEKPPAGKDS
ncbi:MAG: hypothetical protein M1438_20750 [Deltaproteobacteria bacterium]|nr:hypothetical protein [Deltaproteobacteria bacterium]